MLCKLYLQAYCPMGGKIKDSKTQPTFPRWGTVHPQQSSLMPLRLIALYLWRQCIEWKFFANFETSSCWKWRLISHLSYSIPHIAPLTYTVKIFGVPTQKGIFWILNYGMTNNRDIILSNRWGYKSCHINLTKSIICTAP